MFNKSGPLIKFWRRNYLQVGFNPVFFRSDPDYYSLGVEYRAVFLSWVRSEVDLSSLGSFFFVGRIRTISIPGLPGGPFVAVGPAGDLDLLDVQAAISKIINNKK